MQLARELKAKRNAENFELSSSGGRVDAKDAAHAARAERYMRDVEKGLARFDREQAKKAKEEAERAAVIKVQFREQREYNVRVQKRATTKRHKQMAKDLV